LELTACYLKYRVYLIGQSKKTIADAQFEKSVDKKSILIKMEAWDRNKQIMPACAHEVYEHKKYHGTDLISNNR
jgi:hypothetical protein